MRSSPSRLPSANSDVRENERVRISNRRHSQKEERDLASCRSARGSAQGGTADLTAGSAGEALSSPHMLGTVVSGPDSRATDPGTLVLLSNLGVHAQHDLANAFRDLGWEVVWWGHEDEGYFNVFVRGIQPPALVLYADMAGPVFPSLVHCPHPTAVLHTDSYRYTEARARRSAVVRRRCLVSSRLPLPGVCPDASEAASAASCGCGPRRRLLAEDSGSGRRMGWLDERLLPAEKARPASFA